MDTVVIPNVIQESVLSNAGAADLQQARPAPKQGMCKTHVRCRWLQR
ncbi:MAG TPA: hypothetical protein VLG49_08215 [Rhabdochlamydiaceae bacterium]|nr:hypothetical protein [Rhabdochlamydiaceae bacterium]